MYVCKKCGRDLVPIDVSFTLKFEGRGSEEYFCRACIAEKYGYTEDDLDRFAEKWKAEGCELFRFPD